MKTKKNVIITGGAKGVGAACARLFLKESYNVVILDVDHFSGKNLESELGETCFFIACDVSEEKEVKEAFKKAIGHFGEISVLINNAGIQVYGNLLDTSEDVWDHVMNVNLKSHYLCAKESVSSMLKLGGGVIINVSSVQAFISQQNVAAYTTSKSALLGLTRSIAVDYGPNIRCVAICPGSIDTPMFRDAISKSKDPEKVFRECEQMHLMERIAKPEEVAELIGFAASDKASFITGQALRIDGGLGISIPGSKQ
ncbi:glucose 1-dehydrogenase [Gramella sp. AN32]|uniref:Glucose 1-dehydrogenase n=1 Tax=Christiangramia antarctica TaxID=2058158 RepID=A0ABW5X8Z4_9FLAO|nr:glucose 1-dehydrogenase [Gramella sp. AN32]MCM4157578.1 hypothetical protein [Gramella sp. AN32]